MGLRIAACMGWLGIVVAPLLVGACTAEVDGKNPMGGTGATSSTGGSGSSGAGNQTGTCTENAALANARIWRLTDVQYGNAVRQVFGVVLPAEITELDTGTGEFTNLSELTLVNNNAVAAYQSAAKDVARQAVTSHFDKFLGCGASDACVEQFIRNRVARAFGRRLDGSEVTGYLDLFHKGLVESPQVGLRLMIEAALQSPSFIYRTELGSPTQGGPAAGAQVTLTPHEIATSLSFSLTNSVPDETLWQKADSGALADPAVLASEVERLLDSPETRANLSQLAGYWLGIERLKRTEKDTTKFPEFTAELKADMYESAQLFVQDLLAIGSVSDLVTSKRMFLNETMATAFGIPGVTGADMRPVEVSLPERSFGILSQPGVLAAYSRPTRGDPIHRGLFVFYGLVCGGQVPAPPPGALEIAKTFPPDATERELAGLRAANATCKACHARFDPLGLATERFDTMGRYHETDAEGPIDQSAILANIGPDLEGPIDGVGPLATMLTQGRRLSDCAATNLALFTLGRDDVKSDTSCALLSVKDELARTGKFRDFYKALATSPAFIKRGVK
jgi:hypothetical protein